MKYILSLFMIIFSYDAECQEYTVIQVIGEIYNTTSKSYLSPGTKFDESTQLRFDSEDSRAAVLSSTKGRFVIQRDSEQSQESDLIYALSSVITPVRGKLSTRSGSINNQIDFIKRFEEGPVAWLGPEYKIEVSPTAYPMDNERFFYASYNYGGERINKKLESRNNTIIFQESNFYQVDDMPIESSEVSNIELHYYNTTTKESFKLTNLNFVLVSLLDLEIVLNSLNTLPESEKNNAILEILNSLYGACTIDEITSAISQIN